MPPSTCPSPQLLQRFVHGQCRPSEGNDLTEHLLYCQACFQQVQHLRSLVLAGGADEFENLEDTPPRVGAKDTIPEVPEVPTVHGDVVAPVESAASSSEESLYFLAAAEKPGELGRLGSYAIHKVLGEGGMGIVFRAQDTRLDRDVALKVLRPEQAANEQARKRFIQEAKLVASLQHDHIITIFQVDEDRGVPYIAMQLLQGQPLDRCLKAQGKLPIPDVVRIGKEVAEGLAAAHARNLIHRDIKPANIWLEQNPGQATYRVKILDFGLARNVADASQHLTKTGVIMGTPGYMAPEQARATGIDHRCDIFSLGCVLYHATAGREPFSGDDIMGVLMKLAMEEPTPITELNPDAPYYLTHLIERMMAKDPNNRPAAASEVASILGTAERTLVRKLPKSTFSVTGGDKPSARPATTPSPAGKAAPTPPAAPAPTPAPPRESPFARRPLGAPAANVGRPAQPAPVAERPPAAPPERKPAPPPPERKPAPPPPQRKPPKDNLTGPCPKCGAPRTGKAQLGWCLSCGYHPELEPTEDDQQELPPPDRTWVGILVTGLVLMVILSVAGHFLTRPNSLPRARWGVAQLLIAAFLLAGANIWAYLHVFHEDERVGLLSPIRLWAAVIGMLPQTRKPLYVGSWSLTALLGAIFVVGGQTYWLDHMRRGRIPNAPDVGLKKLGGGAAAKENAVDDFANVVGATEEPSDLAMKNDAAELDQDDDRLPSGAPRINQRFTIVGYTGSPMNKFVLAQEVPGGFVYVGLVSQGLTQAVKDMASKKLKPASKSPLGTTFVQANWVQPQVQCEIEYTHVNSSGLIEDALFRGW